MAVFLDKPKAAELVQVGEYKGDGKLGSALYVFESYIFGHWISEPKNPKYDAGRCWQMIRNSFRLCMQPLVVSTMFYFSSHVGGLFQWCNQM